MDENHNLILTIRPLDLSAQIALKLEHNARRYYCFSDYIEDTQISSRENTPFHGNDEEDLSPRLDLAFDKPPKSFLKGWVFGADPRTCDVLLDKSRASGVSKNHFCIKFDDQDRLVLQDTSSYGMNATYSANGRVQGSNDVRRNFTWIIFPDYPFKIHVFKKSLAFQVTLASHEGYEAQYRQHITDYRRHHELERSQLGSLSLDQLNVQSQQSTAGAFEPLSPRQTIYITQKLLGRGSFGEVHQVMDASTGAVYAVKEFYNMAVRKLNIERREAFTKEVEVLRRLNHSHIVQFVHFVQEPFQQLFMEFMPLGNVTAQIKQQQLSSREIETLLHQCLCALSHLHGLNITHRDVKTDNILVKSRKPFLVKLADFGLSKDVHQLRRVCGSYFYLAPEIWEESPYYTSKIDV